MSEPRDIQLMHVVYADGVGYSKLSLDERSRFDTLLSQVITNLPHAARVLAKVDNGDGFALAFDGDPQVAADSALWLLERFSANGPPQVRLGVHTGIGYLRASLAGPATLSGNCIEFAQRMMILSDGKFVACSEAFRQSLISSGSESHLGLPTYGRSKHGELLIAYPLTPKKRIECLFLMQDSCRHTFSTVFDNLTKHASDIHLAWPSIGAEDIAHLLSHQSVADKIIVTPNGRKYDSLLTPGNHEQVSYIDAPGKQVEEELPRVGVHTIHFTNSWLDAERLRIAIQGTHPVLQVGEPLALSSPLYVERPADELMRHAVESHESVILLRASRKFGKTSAVLRALSHAESAGINTVVIDLSAATKENLTSAQRFYQWIIEQLALQAIPPSTFPLWEDIFGPNSNLESAVRHFLAPNPGGNLLVLDGVDRIFECDFRDDFFGLLRSWHNRRALQSDPFWDSLSILLSYSAEGQSLVTDVNQSPFNVGVHLTLEPFSEEQTQELCSLVGWEGGADVFSLTSGHPYLTSLLLGRLVAGDSMEAAISAALASPLMVRLQGLLANSEPLSAACDQILLEGHTSDQSAMWKLLAQGIFASDKTGKLRVGNRLFSRLIARPPSKR